MKTTFTSISTIKTIYSLYYLQDIVEFMFTFILHKLESARQQQVMLFQLVDRKSGS